MTRGITGRVRQASNATISAIAATTLPNWMAGLLAGLGCDFTIKQPEELRESVEKLARRLAHMAGERG